MSNGIRAFYRTVKRCRRCYGELNDIHVPVPDSFPQRPRILIVGEQPYRHAARNGKEEAGGTEHGAEHLRSYLQRSGVDPAEVLYATAVLCVPTDVSLRSGRPTATEVKNCSSHVRGLIERVQPRLVIPLGHTGLLSLQFAFREWTELRQFILNYDIGAVLTRGDVCVYPLYLPSATTLRARPEGRQLRDWQKVQTILESLEKTAHTG